jgi:hypothetical protein
VPLPPRGAHLRPALLARHVDLNALRYDFPLVLTQGTDGDPPVHSLSGIVDDALRRLAPPGPDGERVRRHLLRIEQEVRMVAATGATGKLSELWQQAAAAVLTRATPAARVALADSPGSAPQALAVDGTVMDCTEHTPAAFMTHLWRAAESARSRRFAARINRLILRLQDLLRADFLESPEARHPERLKRGFGPVFESLLDFQSLARSLDGTLRASPLPERRRRRIRAALDVLESQRFTPVARGRAEPYGFAFDGCRVALEAFNSRLPEMAAVVQAIGVAELELDNRYREAVHDPYFRRLDGNRLTPAELAWFPAYLIVVRDTVVAAERHAVLDALSAGLPVKIVVQFDDILPDPSAAGVTSAIQRNRPQLARMAIGLNTVFVLQAGGSHLYRMRHKIRRGMGFDGAALFCVYSGAGAGTAGFAPYVAAAAAVESRAFPLFMYDPSVGNDWADRFDVRDNPQPEKDWPAHRFEHEGEGHRRIVESFNFTFADFAACDGRYAARLQRIPQNRPIAPLVSVVEAVRQPMRSGATAFVPLVDDNHVLHRFAVSQDLVQATHRCADTWRSLQELGGINNSHARRALEDQRLAREREERADQQMPGGGTAPAGQPAGPPPEGVAAAEPAASTAVSDEPYIETPRCTTCEECTRINNRMFVYNENKQAYIADADAGTYRELVEAAETCQVSIIHPGKPRNLAEPGLDELTLRAAPFQPRR